MRSEHQRRTQCEERSCRAEERGSRESTRTLPNGPAKSWEQLTRIWANVPQAPTPAAPPSAPESTPSASSVLSIPSLALPWDRFPAEVLSSLFIPLPKAPEAGLVSPRPVQGRGPHTRPPAWVLTLGVQNLEESHMGALQPWACGAEVWDGRGFQICPSPPSPPGPHQSHLKHHSGLPTPLSAAPRAPTSMTSPRGGRSQLLKARITPCHSLLDTVPRFPVLP